MAGTVYCTVFRLAMVGLSRRFSPPTRIIFEAPRAAAANTDPAREAMATAGRRPLALSSSCGGSRNPGAALILHMGSM